MDNNNLKTTIASKFPKALILGFEKGYNFLPGVMALPINSWKDALDVKKQLVKDAQDAVKEGRETVYKTIVADTGDIAYDYCEKYIVDKENVDYLDETEKLRGYRALSREFDAFFQEICRAGYTLIVISHSTTKQVKENGEKYEKTIPTMPDRGLNVIARLVDVIGFANKETDDETGITTHTLTLKGNKNLEAGSRNPYLPEKIPLTYDALLEAMTEAIDKIEENGGEVVNTEINLLKETEPKANLKDTLAIAKKYAKTIFNEVETGRDDYAEILAKYLGTGVNLKDCTQKQIDQVLLVLDDLRDYAKEHGLEVEE